jgi:hypothetical protein
MTWLNSKGIVMFFMLNPSKKQSKKQHENKGRQGYKNWEKKSNQHVDFPGGHPPEYYPRLTMLNFTDRTGCGAFIVIWPITYSIKLLRIYIYSILNIPIGRRSSLILFHPVKWGYGHAFGHKPNPSPPKYYWLKLFI